MAKKASKGNKVDLKAADSKTAGKPLKAGEAPVQPTPWIQMKTAIYVVTAASILMAALTAWQSFDGGLPLLDSILYGLLFGAMVWIVFYFSQLFFRWLRQ